MLYPPVAALLRHRSARYVQDGHTQRAKVEGTVSALRARVFHDGRKSLARWLSSQSKCADEEAELLLVTPARSLRVQDRIRRMIVVAPWLVPLHFLVVRGGIRDGWQGIYYAMQRNVAESILALRLLERLHIREPQ